VERRGVLVVGYQDFLCPCCRRLRRDRCATTFRGRRIFGDNKTLRGAIVMTTGVTVFACLLAEVPAYWSSLPEGIQHGGPFVFGLLLGLGAVVAELPNSFLKRQLDIGSGKHQRSPVGTRSSSWTKATSYWALGSSSRRSGGCLSARASWPSLSSLP
jgi:hypothetical protein